ncbi:MAG: hypothetical protein ACKVQS_00855, partial [Fimbriimonadaceae bacterium]
SEVTAMSFLFELNHAQRRLAADRLTAVAGGLELNGSIWSGTWIDPVTNTLMLRPKPLDAVWYTTSTGDCAKWGLADFAVGSEWEERQDQHWVGPWLAVKDAANNPAAITTVSFPKNMGLAFSWFSYGAGDTFLQYQVGWNDSANDAAGVALHFWSDGRVDVFRDGDFVESGKISGAKSREIRRLQVFEVMVIPMRKRELLIVSQSGDGFSVVFNDLDLSDLDPAITPAGHVWFRCESGATQAQIAPLRYSASGYATSLKTSFLEAPATGEVPVEFDNDVWLTSPAPYKIYGFPGFGVGIQSASATLVEWDGATAFVQDGIGNEVRLRVDLATTDSRFSPFVMGVQAGYAAIGGVTDGSASVDGSAYVREARLSVPNRANGVALDVSVLRASELDTLVSEGLTSGSLPCRLVIDDDLVLDGFADSLSVDRRFGAVGDGVLVVRDRWAMLDEAVFADRVPLDGLPFDQALGLLVEKSGIESSRVVISSSGPRLPYASGVFSGEWGLLIESGDQASDWLRRLMETFAPGWWYGFRPAIDGSGEEFFALPESEMSAVPVAVLFDSVTEGGAYRRVERGSIEPMANEVRVTGIDPRTERPMQSVRTNYAAQTVAAAVGERAEHWSGTIRRFALVDVGLTEQTAIDSACDALFEAMSVRQELVQFECEFLQRESGVPVWRGDVVTLTGIGDVRIRSFGVRFKYEETSGVYRSAVYTGVLI